MRASDTHEVAVTIHLRVPKSLPNRHLDRLAMALVTVAADMDHVIEAGVGTPTPLTEEMKMVSRAEHDRLVFLQNEVLLAADPVLQLEPGNPWPAFTCAEAELLACIFAAAGRQDAYHHIIHQHALGDEAEEVEFHIDMLDGEDPPVPLGKEATDEAEALRRMVNGESNE